MQSNNNITSMLQVKFENFFATIYNVTEPIFQKKNVTLGCYLNPIILLYPPIYFTGVVQDYSSIRDYMIMQ